MAVDSLAVDNHLRRERRRVTRGMILASYVRCEIALCDLVGGTLGCIDTTCHLGRGLIPNRGGRRSVAKAQAAGISAMDG